MTTTVAEKKKEVPAPVAETKPYKELHYGDVEIARISVVSNFRKNFNEAALKELSESIAKEGLHQPIILRFPKDGKNGYILVAGERRLRASKLAGLKQIKARVLDLDEKEAAQVQATENLHREDLGPIEEARAFKTLLDAGKYDVAGLASRIRKSEVFVYRSLRLLELSKDVLERIESGEWTPAHGHHLLRVPAESRAEVVKEWAGSWEYSNNEQTTAKHLGAYIDNEIGRDLKNAPFPKDLPFAGKIACAACPLNTGNQGQLFEGATKGGCTGPDCFDAKLTEFKTVREKQLAEKVGDRFLGKADHVYRGSQIGGGIVVGEGVKSTLDKEAKVVIDGEGKSWLVSKDQKTIKKVLGYTPGGSSSRGSSSEGETAEKRFIRQNTERGILDVIAKESAKIEKRHWVAIVAQLYNANAPKHILETAGVVFTGSGYYGNGLRKALEPLTVEKLQVMAVQIALWPNTRGMYETGWREEKLRPFGLDAAKVVAKAKADATAAWKAKKAKKA